MNERTGSSHPDEPRQRMTPWRLGRLWRKYRWLAIGGAWLVVGILGYVGFAQHLAAQGQARSPGDLLYLTMQLFVLGSGAVEGSVGWELEMARFLAPAVAAYTAVQALALLFYERFQLFRLRFARDHVVICGLGYKGLVLARGFRQRGDRVVVIDRDEENDLIDQCHELGATVLIGDAASKELLSLARVDRARYLLAVSGDDGTNADVAVRAFTYVAERPGPALTCIVHIVDPRLYDLLRERELGAGKVGRFRMEFFSVYDAGARAVLTQYPPFDRDPGGKPHLLVAGLGQMGRSLVVHVARSWWARYTETGNRLRVSIIDRDAAQKVETLALRYPQLATACELVPLTMEIPSPEFERGDYFHSAGEACDVTIAYVCLDDDTASLSTALALRQKARVPIVARMRHDAGLATLLGGLHDNDTGFDGLYAFGLLDRTCTPEMTLGGTHQILALAIHDRHLQIQREAGVTAVQDPTLVPWERLPEAVQESYRRKADHIGVKLEAVGCTVTRLTDWEAGLFQFEPGEIEIMARMEQQRRIEESGRAGGSDPDLVAWEQLTEPGRQSCIEAVEALPQFLARAGFQVRRVQGTRPAQGLSSNQRG